METVLKRTITYEPTECKECHEVHNIIRKDYKTVDPMKQIYGPGNDNYGSIVFPPGPIPPPDPILSKFACKGCGQPCLPSKIEGLKVIEDSAQESYKLYIARKYNNDPYGMNRRENGTP